MHERVQIGSGGAINGERKKLKVFGGAINNDIRLELDRKCSCSGLQDTIIAERTQHVREFLFLGKDTLSRRIIMKLLFIETPRFKDISMLLPSIVP